MHTNPRACARTAALSLALVLLGGAMPVSAAPNQAGNAAPAAAFDQYYGTVAGTQATTLFFRLRTGRIIAVDASHALLNKMTVLLTPGRAVVVHGKVGGNGVLHAMAIWRENAGPAFWPPDGPLAPAAMRTRR